MAAGEGQPQPGYHFSLEQQLLAEQHPLLIVTQGTEFLQHLNGFEEFWVHNVRDWILEGGTKFLVVWGRTGVGKRLAASEILYLAERDPVLLDGLAERDANLEKEYIAFAEAANLAKLRGLILPSHGHGRYSAEEYRNASIVHSEYTFRNLNNFEGSRFVVLEPSGPTGFVDKDGTPTGTFRGLDKALSTVYFLGEHHRVDTKVLVIKRGEGLEEKILTLRGALLSASWKEMVDIIIGAHLQIYSGGLPVDVEKLSKSALIGLRDNLMKSMAPPEGVIRNNILTDQLMREIYDTGDEATFWRNFLSDLGILASDYAIVDNPVSADNFTLHIDLIDRYDPMQNEIKAREALLNANRGGYLSHLRSFCKRIGSSLGR